jgi:hypothetical protein
MRYWYSSRFFATPKASPKTADCFFAALASIDIFSSIPWMLLTVKSIEVIPSPERSFEHLPADMLASKTFSGAVKLACTGSFLCVRGNGTGKSRCDIHRSAILKEYNRQRIFLLACCSRSPFENFSIVLVLVFLLAVS